MGGGEGVQGGVEEGGEKWRREKGEICRGRV